jgi:hypothetical protein
MLRCSDRATLSSDASEPTAKVWMTPIRSEAIKAPATLGSPDSRS